MSSNFKPEDSGCLVSISSFYLWSKLELRTIFSTAAADPPEGGEKGKMWATAAAEQNILEIFVLKKVTWDWAVSQQQIPPFHYDHVLARTKRHVDVCHIINIKACMLVVAYLSLRNVSGRMQYDLSLLDKRVNQIVPFYIFNISKSSFLPSPTSTHGSFFRDGMLQSTDFFNDSERIEEFPVYKRSWRKKVLFIILIEKTG